MQDQYFIINLIAIKEIAVVRDIKSKILIQEANMVYRFFIDEINRVYDFNGKRSE